MKGSIYTLLFSLLFTLSLSPSLLVWFSHLPSSCFPCYRARPISLCPYHNSPQGKIDEMCSPFRWIGYFIRPAPHFYFLIFIHYSLWYYFPTTLRPVSVSDISQSLFSVARERERERERYKKPNTKWFLIILCLFIFIYIFSFFWFR